jgi:uncharacterized membrane protein YqiK
LNEWRQDPTLKAGQAKHLETKIVKNQRERRRRKKREKKERFLGDGEKEPCDQTAI